jgi:hypothetical protein
VAVSEHAVTTGSGQDDGKWAQAARHNAASLAMHGDVPYIYAVQEVP